MNWFSSLVRHNEEPDLLEQKLQQCLVEGEGMKDCAYEDSLSYLTIGVGRCVDSRVPGSGLTTDEMFYLLRNDIARVRKEIQDYLWYKGLDRVRQDALVEIVFNMGLPHFLEFKETIAALEAKSYAEASLCLKQSKWEKQIQPARVENIAYRLRVGQYPDGAY